MHSISMDISPKASVKKKKSSKSLRVRFADEAGAKKKKKSLLPKSPKPKPNPFSFEPSSLKVMDFKEEDVKRPFYFPVDFPVDFDLDSKHSKQSKPASTKPAEPPNLWSKFAEMAGCELGGYDEIPMTTEHKTPTPSLSDAMEQMHLEDNLDSFKPNFTYSAPKPATNHPPPPTAVIDLMPPSKYGVRLNSPYKYYPYQEQLIDQIKEREIIHNAGMRGSVLVAGMGLGKGLMSLSTVMADKVAWENNKCQGPKPVSLFVCALSLLGNIAAEAKQFFGARMKYLILHEQHTPKRLIAELDEKSLREYDLVITTYDVVALTAKKLKLHSLIFRNGQYRKLDKPAISPLDKTIPRKGANVLFMMTFERIIGDETQTINNPETDFFLGMMLLFSLYKLCLSGTPIKNSEVDIWSHAMFLGLEGAPNPKKWTEQMYHKMNIAHNILIMTKQMAGLNLPRKHEHFIQLEFNPEEEAFNNFVKQKTKQSLADVTAGRVTYTSVLANITKLQQVAVASCLVKPFEDDGSEETARFNAWCQNHQGTSGLKASKIVAITTLVATRIPRDEKFLIFCRFVPALELLQISLALEGITCVLFHGGIKAKDREAVKDSFKTDPTIQGFLATYQSASTGLNMQHATRVIHASEWWNNIFHLQADDRVHRPGQYRECHSYQFVHKNSIEVKMLQKCKEKAQLTDRLLGDNQPGLDVLQSLFDEDD